MKSVVSILSTLGIFLVVPVFMGGCGDTASESSKLYLTLQGSGDAPGSAVSVVNTETDELITTVHVGTGAMPHDVICSIDNTKVFASNPMLNSTVAIDVATDTVANTVDLGENAVPWHVDVSLDGRWVYTANMDQTVVAKMSTSDYTKVADTIEFSDAPWAVASTESNIYVTLNGSIAGGTANSDISKVGVFDVNATDPEVTYLTVGRGPHGLLASHDKNYVYVASQYSHEVWRIDVAANTSSLFTSIPDPAGPDGETAHNPGFPTDIAVSPDDKTVIAFNHDIDSMSFIDASTGEIIDTVSTGAGSQPWGGIYSQDGTKVYVSTNGYSTVSVFDAATRKETKKIDIGGLGPDGMIHCGTVASNSV